MIKNKIIKECPICKKEFILKNSGQKYCSPECHKETINLSSKKWYQKNKEKRSEQIKEYQENNKEKIKDYQKKYVEEHKEESKEYQAEHYQKNKEEINKRRKERYQKNKTKELEQCKKYQQEHREERKPYEQKYAEDHKEEIRIYREKYKLEHKEEIREANKLYARKYRKNPINRLITDYRNRLWSVLKGYNKSANTMKLFGCNKEQLKQHLESKFTEGMNWSNYGNGWHGRGMSEWHVDHIRPCASFDMSKKSEQFKCFNYKNLQPLWATENRIKSDKYEIKQENKNG